MKALVSVIVPVYNVEAYLDQCIQSILSQTYENIEVILVDDGSPDSSGEICDRWAEKDARIIVKHCENGGAGKARNIALKLAKGDYISFVDSDDYISPFMVEFLLNSISISNSVDIAECDYIISENSIAEFDDVEIGDEIKVYTSEEAMREHICDRVFKQVIWNKLYRRSVIQNIFFPEGKLIDDEFWTYQAIGKAKNLAHLNKRLYAYRQQDNSVIHSIYSIKRLQALEAKKNRYSYIRESYPRLSEDALINFWMSCLYQGQLVQSNLKGKERLEAMDCIRTFLKEMPPITSALNKLPLAYKGWAILSKASFPMTCNVRNALRIGL